MKKIGILTFHRAINNGAVLQAYALAKALNSLECDAKYIDYMSPKIQQDYKINPLLRRRTIKSLGVYFLFDINIMSSQKKFNEFIEKYIPLSICEISEEKKLVDNFDILLSGGDQIWNLQLTDNDTSYYLDFTNKIPKYSYGTSFGRADFSEADREKISKLLCDYKKLFVREESGKKLINALVSVKAQVVPDPVFLLTKNQWIDELKLTIYDAEKYILFFELHENELMRSYARKLSYKYKCKILRITNDFFHVKGMKNVKRTGPKEFLNYILNAKIIITDSFHAASFSMIFNKSLYIGLKEGEVAYLNTRIENLVDTFGIQDSIITKSMEENFINYSYVNSKIELERNKGYCALKEIVNE